MFDDPLNLTIWKLLSLSANKHLKIIQKTTLRLFHSTILALWLPVAACIKNKSLTVTFLHPLPSLPGGTITMRYKVAYSNHHTVCSSVVEHVSSLHPPCSLMTITARSLCLFENMCGPAGLLSVGFMFNHRSPYLSFILGFLTGISITENMYNNVRYILL